VFGSTIFGTFFIIPMEWIFLLLGFAFNVFLFALIGPFIIAFVKAKLSRATCILILRDDLVADMVPAVYRQGTYETKTHGTYISTKSKYPTVYRLFGIPIAFGVPQAAPLIAPKIAAGVQAAKQKDPNLKNASQINKEDKSTVDAGGGIIISMQDIGKFFAWDLDPTAISARINYQATQIMQDVQKRSGITFENVLLFCMAIGGIAIAYTILSSGGMPSVG